MQVYFVNEAWCLYRAMVLTSAKKLSQTTEEGRWKNYIEPVVGEKIIQNLTKLDYYKIRQKIEGKSLSPQLVTHCLSLLRRVLNKAVELGVYSGSFPNFKGVFPKFDNRRVRFLSKDELNVLLCHLENSVNWYDITLFAVNTGLRRSEIFHLTASQINISAKMLHVTKTKSHRNRFIPLNDLSLQILKKKIS